jgi:hypothetical protein
MPANCANPYCLQDREDMDCPECGAPQFPPPIEWEANLILQKLREDDNDDDA